MFDLNVRVKNFKILDKTEMTIRGWFSIIHSFINRSINIIMDRCYNFNQLNPVDGTHFSRPLWKRHRSGRVCHLPGHTSSFRGPSPQALTLLRGVRFIAWRQRCPFFREMPTGLESFLVMPGASGQRPCVWTQLKKGLVPHSSSWWNGRQILLQRETFGFHAFF